MIASLLAFAGGAAIGYGAVTGADLALLAGFLVLLVAFGVHEWEVGRRVRRASQALADERAAGQPGAPDWDWWHEDDRRSA